MASTYQNKVKKQYEKDGYFVVKLHKTTANGITDLMCLKEGKSVFIEVKEKNDTLKELQKYRIDQLRLMGFEAFCLKDGIGKIY